MGYHKKTNLPNNTIFCYYLFKQKYIFKNLPVLKVLSSFAELIVDPQTTLPSKQAVALFDCSRLP